MVKFTPAIYACVFLITGIILSPYLDGRILLACAFIPWFTGLLFLKERLTRHALLLSLIFFFIGLFLPQQILKQKEILNQSLPQTITFQGMVVSKPETNNLFQKFNLLTLDVEKKHVRIKLSCSAGYNTPIIPGDVISGIGIISKNDSRYFLEYSLYGTMKIRFIDSIQHNRNWHFWLAKVRDRVEKSVTWGMKGDPSGLITGLMLGIRTIIPPRIQEVFTNSGTVHILAVSGLHLGIISFMVLGILRLFIRNRRVQFVFLSIAVVLYALLIGEQASMIRAAVMMELGIVVYFFDRDRNFYNTIFLSCLILLLYNPYYLFNIGFQLSYAAVLGMTAFNTWFLKILGFIPSFLGLRENVAVSFSAQLLVIPLVLAYFHRVVFISVLANIICVPLSSLNIIIGFVSFFLSFAGLWKVIEVVNVVNGFLIEILIKVSEFFAKSFYFKIETVHPATLAGLTLLIVVFFLAVNYSSKIRLKFATLAAGILLMAAGLALSAEKYVKVFFINAGANSDMVLVQDERKKIVLMLSAPESRVNGLLKNYLLVHNVKEIQKLFLLSPGPSSSLAAECLAKDYKVDEIYQIGPGEIRTGKNMIPRVLMETRSNILWRNVELNILNPVHRLSLSRNKGADALKNAAVIQLKYGSSAILVQKGCCRTLNAAGRAASVSNQVYYRSSIPEWFKEPVELASLIKPKLTIIKSPGNDDPVTMSLSPFREIEVFLYKNRISVKANKW